MNFKQALLTLVALITIGGAVVAVDQHYAKAGDFEQFKKESRATSAEIQRSQLVNQLFVLERDFPIGDRPDLVKQEMARLRDEIAKIDRKLDNYYKKEE